MDFWSRLTGHTPEMVKPDVALVGREGPIYRVPSSNVVLGGPLLGPWPEGTKVLYLGMGCFWGAERKMWQIPGVVGTAVGYMGGFTPHPTYEEVCSGHTGHTETVLVAYDPAVVSTYDILKVFWQNHDPTQGYRQGNDVGTQYRSALYWTDDEQRAVAEATRGAYDEVVQAEGLDPITTEVAPAEGMTFYPAEEYHQECLAKNPNGYDCHANTGIALPSRDAIAGVPS